MYIWMIWMICICIYVVLLGFQTPRPLPYCSIWPDVWWLYIPRPGLGWNARTTEVLHSSSLWSWTFTFCQGIPRHKRTAGSSMAENIYSPTLSRTRGADFFGGGIWGVGAQRNACSLVCCCCCCCCCCCWKERLRANWRGKRCLTKRLEV